MTTTPKDQQPMNEQLAKETCMCGGPIQDHGTGEGGHAPVSQYDHYKAQTTPGEGETLEPFIVKHYSGDERPILKGNGFDGLEIGTDRAEAEEFVNWINKALARHPQELVEILRHAEEWMADEGCDCGVDEPGTCALCEVREALSTYSSKQEGKE